MGVELAGSLPSGHKFRSLHRATAIKGKKDLLLLCELEAAQLRSELRGWETWWASHSSSVVFSHVFEEIAVDKSGRSSPDYVGDSSVSIDAT
jgi:hypothetical protein